MSLNESKLTTKNEAIANKLVDDFYELESRSVESYDQLAADFTAALDQRDLEHAEQVKRLRTHLGRVLNHWQEERAVQGHKESETAEAARAALGEVGGQE